MKQFEVIRFDLGIFQHALDGGPIVLGGLALLIISAFLLLVWGFLAVRHRRRNSRLGGVALSLAVAGYLVYDWRNLSLNCSMRDAQAVREDCVQLLQLRKETFKDKYGMELHLHGSEIPTSFTRLGAKFVRVSAENVQISLIPEDGLTGSAWGFLYDPKRAHMAVGWPSNIRATWYRDFYEFRVYGE